MVHARRRTLVEEQGLLAQIKVGGWVEVEPDYSPDLLGWWHWVRTGFAS